MGAPGMTAVSLPENTVLVVEDHPLFAMTLEAFLEELGYRCEIADNGQIAVDRAGFTDFHAILMDVEMPVLDGLTAARLIREGETRDGRTPRPIIGITGHSGPGVERLCHLAGMSGMLKKPFTLDQLGGLMATVCPSASPAR